MQTRMARLVAGLLLFAAMESLAVAHHSFVAQFDVNKPVTISGIVSKVDWRSPHVWFYVDVEEDGRTVTYECETNNPVSLARLGWRRDTLKPGDRVTVSGSRAHCCDNVMFTTQVTLENGRRIFAGRADTPD